MLPSKHIFFGAIISFLIWLFFPQISWIGFLLIFLSSVLIDFDHYLYYVIKKKDFSLRNAYYLFLQQSNLLKKLSHEEKRSHSYGIILFHGVECWILLFLLTFVNKLFIFVLIGVFIHMILDFIDLYRYDMPFYVKLSQVWVHQKNKKLRAHL